MCGYQGQRRGRAPCDHGPDAHAWPHTDTMGPFPARSGSTPLRTLARCTGLRDTTFLRQKGHTHNMKTQITHYAPPGARVRPAMPVHVVSAADIARAELRASVRDAVARGRAALVGWR